MPGYSNHSLTKFQLKAKVSGVILYLEQTTIYFFQFSRGTERVLELELDPLTGVGNVDLCTSTSLSHSPK